MTIRVIQWATGAMGRTILRRLLERPDIEVVGVLVYHPDKAGRDIGAIAGVPDVGIAATGRPDDIFGLDADVVVHAPRIQPPYHHHDDIAMLLRSGKNVLSINGYSAPGWWGAEHLARFDDAGRAGNSTLMAAGLNPGFAFEKLAVGATGMCTSVANVSVSEIVDTTVMRSPEYVFDVLGFGSEAGAIDPNTAGWPPAALLNGLFSEVVAAAASRLGVALERVETDHVMHPATRDLAVGAGSIAAGRVARTNWRWHGIVGGARLLSLSIEWTMEPELSGLPDSPMWHIEITGDPCVTVDVDLRRHPDDRRTTPEQYGVAGAVLNAVPHVLAAPPGVALPPLAAPWRPSSGR